MGARNETRGRRWGRRALVATLTAVAVQVLGLLLLDGVAQTVVVWVPWPLATIAMVLTMPVARPGLPTPVPSLAQTFVPFYPSLVYLVPSFWMGAVDDGLAGSWFIAGFGVLAVIAGVVLWRRVRHHRRASAPLVPLRRTDKAA